MSYQTSSKLSRSFWLLIGARKLLCFSAQSEGRTAATVWNWSGKSLSPGTLLAVLFFFFVPYFPARLDFPSPPLSAPGSPRMETGQIYKLRKETLPPSQNKLKGQVHTNPKIFETAYFLHESGFCPHETSESRDRNGILLKLLS